MKGTVKWYDIQKGYGFIGGVDGNDVFVHKNEVPFWSIFLSTGDKVEYIPEITIKGTKATQLKVL